MTKWSFGQKVGAGFGVVALLTVLIGAVAVYALQSAVAAKDAVIDGNARQLTNAQALATAAARKSAALRGFLLAKEERFAVQANEQRAELLALLGVIGNRITKPDERQLVADIQRTEQVHYDAGDALMKLRRADTPQDTIAKVFDEDVAPKRDAMTRAIDAFSAQQVASLEQAKKAATRDAERATMILIVIAGLAILLAVIVAFVLARALGHQITTAVSQVQSSSAELQSAANQQATSTKEQSTAMTEISTTITELLATSRQIAESAQRVAQIADQTAVAARTGDATVGRGHDSITGIRRQVDAIVSHMLELGKKSQQIGSVLEIVAELAEQTNILAINATIEAAGAGDAGKRFAVVADEIRKLADRVASSTKEIRSLIEDVRGAVNTTVMTTETGSKAVDAGARSFGDVLSAFQQIAQLVGTTTEAAKEIELSTRQQATAVEQVNVAITNVAQATKETEASTGQTLATASQLGTLSRDLMNIVQPRA